MIVRTIYYLFKIFFLRELFLKICKEGWSEDQTQFLLDCEEPLSNRLRLNDFMEEN